MEAPFVFCLWKNPDLYDDYRQVNEGKDETIKTVDAQFYFYLGRALFNQGFRTFDNITVNSYLKDKKALQDQFEKYGGYKEVENLKQLVDADNVEAYFDKIAKLNALSALCENFFKTFSKVEAFDRMSSQDIYDYFDYQLNTISLATSHQASVEDLTLDESFVDECDRGETVGLSYGRACPILNYMTLGVPLGDLYMIGGHSGVGKSSFAFENMVIPMALDGIKVAIISNEMKSITYKQLLCVHILTYELNYWGITRKHLKTGHFNAEQKEMLRKAAEISKQKFSNIVFIKLFDNDMNKVMKSIKRLAKRGYQAFIWDTMKSDDSMDNEMYRQLLVNSRKLFQLASKENVAIIPTYQLALHMLNQRYLDASCLANGKQIKEVFSEMVYMRHLWQDEYTGQKYDCKAFEFIRDSSGKFTKSKNYFNLDPDKKYVVAFLDKTRNDEDKQQILYEVNFRYNRWRELGYCTIQNDHRQIR